MPIYDMNEADYHAHAALGKSGLWTIHTRTPFHYRYAPRKSTKAFDVGTATHFAILQPELFEARVMRGPEDRRGNKWKDAQDFAQANGLLLLIEADYDAALLMRDAVHKNALVRKLTNNAMVEKSAFSIDEATGVEVKCRPDLYHPGTGIMLDLKTTADAGPGPWARSAANYGYHVQEPYYTKVWQDAGGGAVNGFVFLTVEKDAPHALAIYELEPAAVAEGQSIIDQTLAVFATCKAESQWPAYGDGIIPLGLPRWAYRNSNPDENFEA